MADGRTRGARRGGAAAWWVGMCLALAIGPGPLSAQDPQPAGDDLDGAVLDLTLERMVEFALDNSFQVRRLNLDVARSRLNLQASRARLKSRVELDFTLPRIAAVSETRWNSDLQRNVISRENSRRVQTDLSIRQPIVLFGYPTNGYLSLTNRLYRLTQHDGDADDIRYYNRYFVSYTQPLFQTNSLRNSLERAEMALTREELGYYGDIVGIIDDVSDDYFELFEIAWEEDALEAYVEGLESALAQAESATASDPERRIDVDQITIELANARESLNSQRSRWRLETSSIRTDLDLPQSVEIVVEPVVDLRRIPIDPDEAVRYAMELSPRMRQLDLGYRENEIRLDETRGRGGFELDLSLTYGREMQDEIFGNIWEEPENTYTVDVRGSLPIWDWGERKSRIQASELNVDAARLRIEEATADIENDVRNEVRNVAEYEERAFSMQSNLELARSATATTLERYAAGSTGALDVLQSLRREFDTANNFLDTYLGWRRALQRIQRMTYFDFESGSFLLDAFGVEFMEVGS